MVAALVGTSRAGPTHRGFECSGSLDRRGALRTLPRYRDVTTNGGRPPCNSTAVQPGRPRRTRVARCPWRDRGPGARSARSRAAGRDFGDTAAFAENPWAPCSTALRTATPSADPASITTTAPGQPWRTSGSARGRPCRDGLLNLRSTAPGEPSARFGDELVAECRGVRLEPALSGLAFLHAEDLDPGGRDLATRGGEPRVVATVGPPVDAADHDPVTVDQHPQP